VEAADESVLFHRRALHSSSAHARARSGVQLRKPEDGALEEMMSSWRIEGRRDHGISSGHSSRSVIDRAGLVVIEIRRQVP
jgi:hypothetical protein